MRAALGTRRERLGHGEVALAGLLGRVGGERRGTRSPWPAGAGLGVGLPGGGGVAVVAELGVGAGGEGGQVGIGLLGQLQVVLPGDGGAGQLLLARRVYGCRWSVGADRAGDIQRALISDGPGCRIVRAGLGLRRARSSPAG